MTTTVKFGERIIGWAEPGTPAKRVDLSDILPVLSAQAGIDRLTIIDLSDNQPPSATIAVEFAEGELFGRIVASLRLTQERLKGDLAVGRVFALFCEMGVPTPGGDEAEVNA